jgi:hypothetical protein
MDAKTFAKNFHVTDAARVKIAARVSPGRSDQELITIAKAKVSGHVVWGVGLLDRGDLPEEEISTISGVRFFVDPQWRNELLEQQLDVRDGRLVLLPRMPN